MSETKTILVADDSPTIVEIMRFMLNSMGYEVEVAVDGIEAIERTYAVQPDLILLDIEMPKMNGYQVCRLIKADRATNHIPVLILTSRDLASDRFWGLATGADEYVVKDLEDESLFERIQDLLAESETRKRPAELATQDVSEVGVLEQVNALLDSKLFQSTIVNELGSLAVKMSDFEETAAAVLDLLGKVVDFAVAVLVVRDQPESYAYVEVHSAISEDSLAESVQRLEEECDRHSLVVDMDRVRAQLQEGEEGAGRAMETYVALPMMSRNRVSGWKRTLPCP
jgi:twitching motility two-component system response regulator PilH